MRRIVAAALAALGCVFTLPAWAAGLSFIEVPAAAGQPTMQGAVWYPCAVAPGEVAIGKQTLPGTKDCPLAASHLPLVVISHGFGGWFGGHHDTAEALANAGFVVAAISHPSDSARAPESQHKPPVAALTDRPADIKRLIDYMLGAWPSAARIDPERIGFFGFSRGGFTGLELIGGNFDFAKALAEVCPETSTVPGCAEARKEGPPTQPLTHDPRIKAAVIADPLFGRIFDMKAVRIPVQLWASEEGGDGVLPDDAAAVDRNLATKPDYHTVSHAAHFAFLPPCSAHLAQARPEICTDAAGFDRAAFHAHFDTQIVAFMTAHLVSQQ
jgi:predicted dienelactone hydrolase